MSYQSQDTIAALATAPGRGGIGVVRLSGPQVPDIAAQLLGKLPKPRYAHFADFCDQNGELIDQGLALYFPAPNSFTGEHVLELQGHGGMQVMDNLLSSLYQRGARPARPGEFSERAFLNGKIDLVQAEAIADLIDSSSAQAARSALRSLQGEFSEKIHQLVENLTWLRTYIEAGIDFPDEEIDLLADGVVAGKIAELLSQLQRIVEQSQQGYILKEGMHLVIIGHPNVGKSSLLNRLAGRETAIVTDIAGTTRDIVRDSIHIDGMPLHITDTAGLRETDDPVEREGIRRAHEALATADAVLLMMDDREAEPPPELHSAAIPDACKRLLVRNKCDLSGAAPGFNEAKDSLRLSVKTEVGLDALKQWLKDCMGFHSGESGTWLARRRHLEALADAEIALENASAQVSAYQSDLAAEDLRQAQQALGQITGEVTSDDLLGRIFSSFCIGK